jgi:hypothetical protein
MLRHQKHLCDRWGQLERAVRTGRPVGRSSRGPAAGAFCARWWMLRARRSAR